MTVVATYNMQGGGNWPNVGGMMGRSARMNRLDNQEVWVNVDVLCLQECGVPPDAGLTAISTDIAVGTYRNFDMTYCEWGEGNVRCSLAILSRFDILGRETTDTRQGLRPILGVTVRDTRSGFDIMICSAHMPSGNHRFAAAVAHDTVANNLTGVPRWMILGDFNSTPSEHGNLAGGRDWDVVSQSTGPIHFAHADQATHMGGNNLDYLIGNHPAQCIGMRGMSSDHAAVFFEYT